MHDYLLTAIGCLCIGTVGLSAGKCSQTVWARRDTFYVAQGGSGSLSCVVQHCGDPWTGNWIFQISSQDKLIESTERYHLTNVTVSENKTRLFLNFLKVNQSDEGFYGCKITWGTGVIERGHLTYLNITAGSSIRFFPGHSPHRQLNHHTGLLRLYLDALYQRNVALPLAKFHQNLSKGLRYCMQTFPKI